jgi:hypothetical protein
LVPSSRIKKYKKRKKSMNDFFTHENVTDRLSQTFDRYLLIQYAWFQLSAVHCGPKENQRNKRFISFETPTEREKAVTW